MNSSAYESAKRTAAWFIRKDLSVLRASGNDALDFLNRISTNDLRDVAGHKGKQTVLTSDKGRIVDVLNIVPDQESLLLILSKNNFASDVQHIRKYVIMDDVRLKDESESYGIIELSGPHVMTVLSDLFSFECAMHEIMHTQRVKLYERELLLIQAAPLVELSYWLVYPLSGEYEKLLIESLTTRIPQLSTEEYEILRVEAGIGQAGTELNDEHNPLEANLLHLVNFKKGCYIGQEVIARLDSYNKVKQRLMGFASEHILVTGMEVVVDNTTVGRLTSVAHSPDFDHIALGYIRNEHAIEQRRVELRGESGSVDAVLQSLPFHAR